MDDLPIPTANDGLSKPMDLENHLRGMILSNGDQPSTDIPVVQQNNQAQQQPPANQAQQLTSGKQNDRSHSPGGALPASRQESLEVGGRQQEGQTRGHQPLASSIRSVGGFSSHPPGIRRSLQNQAQQGQDAHRPAYGSSSVTPNLHFDGRRSYQTVYQEPMPNTSRNHVQHGLNRQQTELRHPYVDVRGMHAVPNSTSMSNSANYRPHRTLPPQQSPYANFVTGNQNLQAQYPRPIPLKRQLYEPNSSQPQNHNQHRPKSSYQMSDASVRAQSVFLEQLAAVEIPKAAISLDELQEKEALRIVLEDVCCKTITEHERKKNGAFDEKSVSLKCFGSLASGFATHSADMDLALISPHSKPESSSPESEIPRLLEKALLDLGYGVRLLTKTRVPIIKFCEKPTPELAAKLLEERAKYEKERDAPPKPKIVKKTEDSKKATEKEKPPTVDGLTRDHMQSTQSSKAAQNPDLDSGPKTSDPVNQDIAKVEVLEAVTAKESGFSQDSREISVPCINLVDDAKIDESKHSSASVTSGKPLPHQDVTKLNGQKIQDSKNPKVTSATKTEKATDLSMFSDEELVRLYDLAIKEGWFEHAERLVIMNFKEAVGKYGPNSDYADLAIARSNLQTLTDVLKRYRAPPEHHLDFPKSGVGIQCDINFSNQLAVHNTHLLKCYGLCDSRVRPMVLFVKAWAKRRKINSPYHGTLSSYGYVLMVLHYLVNVAQPSVVPNLQVTRKAAQDKSPENDIVIDGYNVRFWRSEDEIVDLAKRGMLTHNREDTVGSLLRGFFQYFAQGYSGFSWSTDVLSIRTEGGLVSKAQKGWIGAKTVLSEPTAPGQEQKEIRHRYLFAIEDPFEIDHNIARTVVHNGIVAIRDEFRRAHSVIQSAGIGDGRKIDDLFAEAESKENLQYRAFGPMPKKVVAQATKNGKETDGLSTSKAKEVGSTKKTGQVTASSVGNTEETGTIPKRQNLPAKPDTSLAPVKVGENSNSPKAVSEKSQPQASNKTAQVIPLKQSLSSKPSINGTLIKEKIGPEQNKAGNTGSPRAKIGGGGATPQKSKYRTRNAAPSAPVIERKVGPVYKNGKEIVGSSGRIGEAGVIPRRPEDNTKSDAPASTGNL